jgi:hypothetical protein
MLTQISCWNDKGIDQWCPNWDGELILQEERQTEWIRMYMHNKFNFPIIHPGTSWWTSWLCQPVGFESADVLVYFYSFIERRQKSFQSDLVLCHLSDPKIGGVVYGRGWKYLGSGVWGHFWSGSEILIRSYDSLRII